ncbi:MAG TPA: ATP-binding protein [Thermoanaerobaculia bacterium]|nr:ATP-binding protein [Thermoanaerobaculia bacterium]
MSDSSQRDGAISNEELMKVFSVLAHDLKSPIFSIDGFSELLQSDYADKLDDDGRDFLARIRSSVGQIKKVIDEMSQVIKIVARPNSARPVNIGDVIEEIRLKLANRFDESQVELHLSGDFPTVTADPEKVKEALAALISNALSFNERPAGEQIVEIEAGRDGAMHTICVRDNGIGIDPKYTEQIFELGLKLDKQKGVGPGYGLFLARRIAQTHGGDVTVESTPGEGSTFCLRLPA